MHGKVDIVVDDQRDAMPAADFRQQCCGQFPVSAAQVFFTVLDEPRPTVYCLFDCSLHRDVGRQAAVCNSVQAIL